MFASFNALAKTQGCKDWLLNFKKKWNLDIGSLPHRPSGEPPEIKNKAPTGKPFAASFLTSNWNNLEEDIEKSGGSFFGTKVGSKNENQNWFSTYGLVKGGTKHASIFGTKIASKNGTSFLFKRKKIEASNQKKSENEVRFFFIWVAYLCSNTIHNGTKHMFHMHEIQLLWRNLSSCFGGSVDQQIWNHPVLQ